MQRRFSGAPAARSPVDRGNSAIDEGVRALELHGALGMAVVQLSRLEGERKVLLRCGVPRRHWRRRCANANDGEEQMALELHSSVVVIGEHLARLEEVWRMVLRGGARRRQCGLRGAPLPA